MKTRLFLTATLAVALLAVPVIVIGQSGFDQTGRVGPGPGVHGKRFGGAGFGGGGGVGMLRGFLGRLGDKIGLDEDQRAEIELIAETEGPMIRGYFEQMQVLRREFTTDNDPESFDEAAFRSHAEEMAQIQVEIKVASARAMAKAWAVLTEDQKQELEELRELMGPRGRFGRHHRGPGHGGHGGHGGGPAGGEPEGS
jgi:Spy/CpxP family protein refolding chaperone